MIIWRANTKEFQDKAMEADFLIFGTPNYHGSYSGILKNALDYILFLKNQVDLMVFQLNQKYLRRHHDYRIVLLNI
jgi:NAD(P)H-dependent FMN reductase